MHYFQYFHLPDKLINSSFCLFIIINLIILLAKSNYDHYFNFLLVFVLAGMNFMFLNVGYFNLATKLFNSFPMKISMDFIKVIHQKSNLLPYANLL